MDFNFARITWLNDSFFKICSNKRSPRLELNRSLFVGYVENYFGGFIRIIEKGSDSLFIPEGRNGKGFNLFLAGIARAIAMMKEIDAKTLAIEQTSHKGFSDEMVSNNLELDFFPFNENNLCEMGTSISGTLLQVDIENFNSFNHSLDLVSIDEVHGGENISESDAFINLKEFFQDTLTKGVDSLSHYLVYEFERLLTSALGNHKTLTMMPTEEEKSSRALNNLGKADQNKIGALESSVIGITGDCANSGWDYANHDYTDNLYAAFDFEGAFGGSNSSLSGDEFLGHVSENEKRVPISTEEDLWDSDTNELICQKALLVTRENCLPTQNLNTQRRSYKKKNQRSHLMRTRSQTRMGL
ncbi:unnamed protein product [Cuscuta epithymum]|uniref:Uncharacterized protein n=1 Tax=Cuscuta epithymum TaxID=186058 RepID=A0AAV0DQ93_9ASTE|nr:unnamed protein product [Cuscuta epithymum]